MIRVHSTSRAFGLTGCLVVFAVFFLPLMAHASSQSFNVLDNKAQAGMIMSLTADAGVVEPASDKNASLLIGVLGAGDTSFDQQPGQVSVETDGNVSALVSTQNGDILVGDRITVSSLVGFGAKATSSGWIVGVAQASLDAKTSGALAANVTDNQGKQHQVYVARIPLAVKVTYYTVPSASSPRSIIPPSLQSAVDAIAGKHVSAMAIILSFLLLVTGVVLAGVLINSAVRNGFSAIARQPLVKKIILRRILLSFAMSVAILAIVALGALAILRVF